MKNKLFIKVFVNFFLLICLANFGLLANDWYNSNVEYFKITTTKNRIAKLEINRLLAIAPNLENQAIRGLQLILNGEKYPFYYDSGTVIKPNSHLYFFGKQAKTDSTFFDDYTNEVAFYLYYDASDSCEKFNDFSEPSSVQSEINSVFISEHFEKDSVYYAGSNSNDFDNNRFAGWYWKSLQDYPGNGKAPIYRHNAQLIKNILFFPAINSATDFEIAAHLTTLSASTAKPNIKRKIYLLANSDTVGKSLFETLENNYVLSAKINSQQLFSGANSLQILSLTNDNIDHLIGVNCLEISGFSKPFAINSSANFEVQNVAENSSIQINGFADSTIIIYDTLSKSIVKKQGIPSLAISINCQTNSAEGNAENAKTFTTVRLNDSLFASEIAGFHIAILRAGETNIEFYSFEKFDSEVNKIKLENLIKNISQGSFVAIAYNGNENISPTVKNFIEQNGGNEINRFTVGSAYSFFTKVGDNSSKENYSAANFSEFDTTFFDAEKRGFALKFNVSGDSDKPAKYYFNIADEKGIENVSIDKTVKTDYKNAENSAEMIIIYHKKFTEEAQKYANYRKNQGYKIFIADVEEIYKEFNFGKKSPLAIKDFLKNAHENWQKPTPKYVLLIGGASNDPRFCKLNSKQIDYIPTFGNPASDYLFGAFEPKNAEHKAEMIIGRIPAASGEQIENYLAKVISYESAPAANWFKRFVFINGGKDATEQNIMRRYSSSLAQTVGEAPICAEDTLMFNKNNDSATTTVMKNEIINVINSGAGFTVFNGHGSPRVFEVDGWEVENLNNKDKFGILITASCNTGNFAEPTNSCRNGDYILAKDKGFVVALGATSESTISSNNDFVTNFLDELLPKTNKNLRRIGDLVERAKQKMDYFSPSEYTRVMQYCFSILGDPLISLNFDTIPDVYIVDNITVQTANSETIITENDDSIYVAVQLGNAGISHNSNFTVQLEHTYQNATVTYSKHLSSICRTQEIIFTLPIKNQAGEHTIKIIADSDNKIVENDKKNNTVLKNFYVYNAGLLAVEPLPYWNVKPEGMLFRQINPLSKTGKFLYNFSIFQVKNGDTLLVKSANSDFSKEEFKISENYIDWMPDFSINSSENVSYFLSSQLQNLETQLWSEPLIVPFNTYANVHDEEAIFALVSNEELNAFELENMIVFENLDGKNTIILEENSQIGSAISPMIGPATKWNNLTIYGNFLSKNFENKIEIIGYENINSSPEKLCEFSLINSLNTIDFSKISEINAEKFPFVKIIFSTKISSENSNDFTQNYFNNLKLSFVPAAEIAVSEQTNFVQSSILRGDTAKLNLVAENISLRAKSLQSLINIDVYGENSNTVTTHFFDLPSIPSDRTFNLQLNLESDFAENSNTVTLAIDKSNFGKELHQFNNTVSRFLGVSEDTVKPQLEIYFDNALIFDKDNISAQPTIEIKLFDNSSLPVTAVKPLTVRLNFDLLDSLNTDFYEMETFAEKGSKLKAKLKIIPKKITDRENYFTFTGIDAAGNASDTSYYLYVPFNNSIKNLINFPNPVQNSDEILNFEYYLVSSSVDLSAELEIFNEIGLKIKTLKTSAKANDNHILWDLKDNSGRLINPGRYFYRLKINSEFLTEPQQGSFIFVK